MKWDGGSIFKEPVMGFYELCGPKLIGKISCQIIMGVKKSEIILELEKSNEGPEWSMRTVEKEPIKTK